MISPSATTRSGGIFDFETRHQRLAEVSQLLEDPNVWNDNERSQKLGREKRELEYIVSTLTDVQNGLRDSRELFEMAREENDDDTLLGIQNDTDELEKQVAEMEFRRMFSHPMDANNCFMDIQSGSGGTEEQDCASMLFLKYLRS